MELHTIGIDLGVTVLHLVGHNTYRHIKVTLSAMFTFAKRKGIFDGVNPMCGVSIPKGRKHGRKRLAYSLLEVEAQLQAFTTNRRC